MSMDLFDADYYRIANPDLASAGLTTNAQLSSHFQAYGLNEGRSFSPMLNLSFYRDNNPDLAKAGLTTNKQLLDHLQKYGVAEGRHFSPFVDLNFYLQDYSDLTGAFKGDREQALQHLETFGLKEGRQFSPYLDLNFYLANNSDVNKAVAGSQLGALEHLETYGLKEGRLFSPFIDLNLYRAFNPDLKSFDNSQSLQHLETYGIGEGRQFSYTFDLDYYASNNPDLLTFYAAGKKMRTDAVVASPQEFSSFRNFAVNHFMINGMNEGRRSSQEFDVSFYKAENSDLAKFNNLQLYQHFRSYGLNEARQLSDAYDAKYYSTNNSAPAGLNQKQLYEYHILTGKNQGDFATENSVFPDEVLPSLNLTSGKTTVQATLSSNSQLNPTRVGSYSENYMLGGVDVGQQVQIDLTAKYDTILQLIDRATGEIITQNDNISPSNLNSQINFTAQPNTEYVVRATSVDASALGDFTLTASAASTVVGPIKATDSISGNLSNTDLPNPDLPGSFRRDYSLDLTGVTAGQVVKVDLNSSTFYTSLELVNADTKEVIDESDSGGSQTPNTHNSELFFRVTSGINYILRASSFTSGATGSFTLTTAAAVVAASITRNQAVTGTLKDNNVDTYNLDTTGINLGDQIQLNLNSAKFDTFLEVTGSDGSTANNDNANGTTNSELTITQKANTTYTIKVSRAAKDTLGNGSYTLTTTPLTGTDNNFTLSDPGMQSVLGSKTTLSRADVLAFFTQVGKDGTVTTAEQADLKKLADNAVRFQMADSVSFLFTKVNKTLPQTTDATASVLQAAVDRWFLGKQPPYPVYTGKGDTARGEAPEQKHPVTYVPIKGNLYGTDSEAKIRGINQGGLKGLGDCSFLAALEATFATPQYESNENTSSSIINQMIQDNGDGTTTFRFFYRGMPSYVTVDREVPTVKSADGTSILAFAQRGGVNSSTALNDDNSSIWGPLTERAYAQFREGLETGGKGYDLIGNGDTADNTLAFVTGRQVDYYMPNNNVPFFNNKTQKAATFNDITNALAQSRAVEVGTKSGLRSSALLVGGHAYAVTSTYVDNNKNQHVIVRNPWGTDGGKESSGKADDGFIDLSYEELTQDFDELAFA